MLAEVRPGAQQVVLPSSRAVLQFALDAATALAIRGNTPGNDVAQECMGLIHMGLQSLYRPRRYAELTSRIDGLFDDSNLTNSQFKIQCVVFNG